MNSLEMAWKKTFSVLLLQLFYKYHFFPFFFFKNFEEIGEAGYLAV